MINIILKQYKTYFLNKYKMGKAHAVRFNADQSSSSLVFGRQRLAANLLGFVCVLFGWLWIGLHVSTVKTAKQKQTLCDHTWPLVASAKSFEYRVAS